jgi:hypothetical protein
MPKPLPANSVNVIAVVPSASVNEEALGPGLRWHPGALGLGLVLMDLSTDDRAQFVAEPPDAAWLAGRLAAQHEAIARMTRAFPVYPLQFGVITEDLDALVDALHRRAADLAGYFQLVDGCSEWALRVSCAASRAKADGLDAAEEEGLSGLDWLKRRKAAAQTEPVQVAARLAELRQALAPVYAKARALVERESQVEPPGRQTLLNIALLLPVAEVEVVSAAVRSLEGTLGDGLQLSFSGPWAPYSFRPRVDVA